MSVNKPAQYSELGASLYTPCSHSRLSEIFVSGVADARSMIFCTEDAVLESELEQALENLACALVHLQQAWPHVASGLRFVRPRNPQVLARILNLPGIELFSGIVLPKSDSETLPSYQEVLALAPKHFVLMPTLETLEATQNGRLPVIRQLIEKLPRPSICIRIGGNDFMNLIGLKRQPGTTIYDTPLRLIIEQIVWAFRPYGFELSSPVCDCIDDIVTLRREVESDIRFGFYAKTAIYPKQIKEIESLFKAYSQANIDMARAVLDESSAAVFQQSGQMLERTCHANWASRVLSLVDEV